MDGARKVMCCNNATQNFFQIENCRLPSPPFACDESFGTSE